jgi:hypothetical protein
MLDRGSTQLADETPVLTTEVGSHVRHSRGPTWRKTITLKPDEFIRRFLMHVWPNGVVSYFIQTQ